MSLIKLRLPSAGAYKTEIVWAQARAKDQAEILSVPRFSPYGFRDIVLCHSVEDDEVKNATDIITPGGHTCHSVLSYDAVSPEQSMALTESMREVELHLEVWSLTMRLPGEEQGKEEVKPLAAGLCIPPKIGPIDDATALAIHALSKLTVAAKSLGLNLLHPTLHAATGNELGTLRDRKQLRRLALVS